MRGDTLAPMAETWYEVSMVEYTWVRGRGWEGWAHRSGLHGDLKQWEGALFGLTHTFLGGKSPFLKA